MRTNLNAWKLAYSDALTRAKLDGMPYDEAANLARAAAAVRDRQGQVRADVALDRAREAFCGGATRLSTVQTGRGLLAFLKAILAYDQGDESARLSLIRLGWIRQTTNPKTGKAYRSKRRWIREETGRVVYADSTPGARERSAKAVSSGALPTHEELHGSLDDLQNHKPLSDRDVASARRSHRLLMAHHGHGALHRLGELLHADLAAYHGTQDGAEKARLVRRLLGFRMMLEWHRDEAGGAGPHGPRPTGIASVPTNRLHADPERFQYKLNVQGPHGVGEEFRDVKQFRPEFAGVVLAWRDPANGKDYVVNGHHRYELAVRTGHPHLAVHYITAPNAKHARAIGALANIAEGRGTAVDAAKFMRDTGTTVQDFEREGVSLRGGIAKDASVLSRLADPLFRRVALEQMPVPRALAIGRELPAHGDQIMLADLIDRQEGKGKKVSPEVVEEMAKEIAHTARTTQETTDLFGAFAEDRSLFLERNQLKAAVRDSLAREASAFKAVSTERKAKTLERGKNVLNVEENKRIAQEAERTRNAFDALANYKGELSDAINTAAEQLFRSPRQRPAILARLTETARELLRQHIGGGGRDEQVA